MPVGHEKQSLDIFVELDVASLKTTWEFATCDSLRFNALLSPPPKAPEIAQFSATFRDPPSHVQET